MSPPETEANLWNNSTLPCYLSHRPLLRDILTEFYLLIDLGKNFIYFSKPMQPHMINRVEFGWKYFIRLIDLAKYYTLPSLWNISNSNLKNNWIGWNVPNRPNVFFLRRVCLWQNYALALMMSQWIASVSCAATSKLPVLRNKPLSL